ncbi:pyridoxal phosphate-dependent decarboxylase family protein [Asanoa iriomotensis]|uniref:Aspartate aminotransferase family protein n=1 Tax=Asanoa iriomotensis TaxID=234613 RepID=A0ABQ4BWV5_9ACTN|nr:pyridoxal-dependent decarboxylase [Asanoa iriomotensis]GIF55013.1 aspartate aminotransferase family protein [Asanoa iriomotensis]
MDPLHDQGTEAALRAVFETAGPYLSSLAERPVYAGSSRVEELAGALPASGEGAAAVAERLLSVGTESATHSAGPRFFHFVTGGVTPAALAADWTVSLLDQNAFSRAASEFATSVETVALDWLRSLFGLPASFGGALVGSATFANFTALGAATHWWGARHGVDVTSAGLAGLPRMPVFSGGYVHASARKALQMLGHGRDSVAVHGAGRVDLSSLDRALASSGPSVVIANAGEVNTGDFDPLADLADVVARHDAWLHVDGAFGLFAAVSPRTSHLVAGLERADSIACDGHKWLNVPYESGFAFLREPARLGAAFGMPGAPYLPGADSPRGGYGLLGPESSRRARSVPIWATLAAYGRSGYQAMVERHLDLAQELAELVDAAPELERLAEVPLCVVCFRVAPPGVPESDLDDLNRRVGEALLEDGRVFAGTTVWDGKVALRPAIVNWRTTSRDIRLFVSVVRELAASSAL